MKDPCSPICGALSLAVVSGPLLLCKTSEGLLSNRGEEKKTPLKKAYMHSHKCKQAKCVCVYVHVKLTVYASYLVVNKIIVAAWQNVILGRWEIPLF